MRNCQAFNSLDIEIIDGARCVPVIAVGGFESAHSVGRARFNHVKAD